MVFQQELSTYMSNAAKEYIQAVEQYDRNYTPTGNYFWQFYVSNISFCSNCQNKIFTYLFFNLKMNFS